MNRDHDRKRVGFAGALFAFAAGLAFPIAANAATFVTFDAPGGTNTRPRGMNNVGSITGDFAPTGGGVAGFVRAADGTFSTFQVKNSDTTASGINDRGSVTGSRSTKEAGDLCFLRHPNGRAIICGPLSQHSSEGRSINKSGVICGDYEDDTFATHGFVWDTANGATVFDAPGAIETEAFSINDGGATTGFWTDANQVVHGFIRAADG